MFTARTAVGVSVFLFLGLLLPCLAQIQWQNCDIYSPLIQDWASANQFLEELSTAHSEMFSSDQKKRNIENENFSNSKRNSKILVGMTASCTTLSVPLDHGNANSPTIPYFVKRINAFYPRLQDVSGQLWLLSDGPGIAGSMMETVAVSLARLLHDFDIYIPDHRGTGRSNRLGCPTEESVNSFAGVEVHITELKNCSQYFRNQNIYQYYTVNQAAYDLGETIKLVKQERDGRVHILGVGYGAYLANRYMLFYPDQADLVTMDSILSPILKPISDYNFLLNSFFQDTFLPLCSANSLCSLKMTSSRDTTPSAYVLNALNNLASTCTIGSGFTKREIQYRLGEFFVSGLLRELIPPLVHRVTRCSDDDKQVLQLLFKKLNESGLLCSRAGNCFARHIFRYSNQTLREDAGSLLLQYNIGFNELYNYQTLAQSNLASEENSLVLGYSVSAIENVAKNWPKYTTSEDYTLTERLAGRDRSRPLSVLILQGTLDPNSPENFIDFYRSKSGFNETIVILPEASHGTVFPLQNRVRRAEDPNYSCGMEMAAIWNGGVTVLNGRYCR
eukprot:TRINITY_DN6846_c0_g1_i2.p1 TRINITY_DN6846_c0_g1~~TRINITY_DN6846_c0_g1_i2.p1  ORF type:complete len:560 (-),score=80.74 TRINITY_DN6846_c0_g1_i2:1106-2785(-)